jgi:hypothetical protein
MAQIHVFARLFLAAGDDRARAQVFAEALEWIEHTAETTIEKGLKTRVFAILCTKEGADFLRWVTANEASNGHS